MTVLVKPIAIWARLAATSGAAIAKLARSSMLIAERFIPPPTGEGGARSAPGGGISSFCIKPTRPPSSRPPPLPPPSPGGGRGAGWGGAHLFFLHQAHPPRFARHRSLSRPFRGGTKTTARRLLLRAW